MRIPPRFELLLCVVFGALVGVLIVLFLGDALHCLRPSRCELYPKAVLIR